MKPHIDRVHATMVLHEVYLVKESNIVLSLFFQPYKNSDLMLKILNSVWHSVIFFSLYHQVAYLSYL